MSPKKQLRASVITAYVANADAATAEWIKNCLLETGHNVEFFASGLDCIRRLKEEADGLELPCVPARLHQTIDRQERTGTPQTASTGRQTTG